MREAKSASPLPENPEGLHYTLKSPLPSGQLLDQSRPMRQIDSPNRSEIAQVGLILRPIIHRCRPKRSAYHARYTELDLSGRRSGDATERECALTDLAPGGDIPLV